MDFTTAMADKTNGLLLIDSCASKASDHCDPRGVKGEFEAKILQGATPIPTGVSSEIPSSCFPFSLKLEKKGFDGRNKTGRMTPTSLQNEGNSVMLEIDVLEIEGGLSQSASLVDGNRPTDSLPILEFCTLDDSSFGISDLSLLIDRIHLQSHFGSGVFGNKIAIHGLVQDEAKDTHVVDGGIPANLFDSPINVGEAHFPGDLAGRLNLAFLEELHPFVESSEVAFKGLLLVLVRLCKPWLYPLTQLSFTPLGGGNGMLAHFASRSHLSGFAGILNRIRSHASGLLDTFSPFIYVFNPPKRASVSLVQACHSVGSVGKNRTFCNTIRENQRETNKTCLCRNNSWFKSMRGSSSVYQGLRASVGKSVGNFTSTALFGHPAHV